MKIIGFLIRLGVIIAGFYLIASIFETFGFGKIFGSSFEKYERDGGSVFIEGPDALDPLENNEPLFGGGDTSGTEPLIQAPENVGGKKE